MEQRSKSQPSWNQARSRDKEPTHKFLTDKDLWIIKWIIINSGLLIGTATYVYQEWIPLYYLLFGFVIAGTLSNISTLIFAKLITDFPEDISEFDETYIKQHTLRCISPRYDLGIHIAALALFLWHGDYLLGVLQAIHGATLHMFYAGKNSLYHRLVIISGTKLGNQILEKD